jgi:hypothetical protein
LSDADADPGPDPANHFDADPDPDPDPAYHFDTDLDPNPTFQFDPDPDPQQCSQQLGLPADAGQVAGRSGSESYLSI